MTRVRIGCQVDHDMSQYQFSRNSGLPVGYYERHKPLWAWTWRTPVVLAVAVIVYLWVLA